LEKLIGEAVSQDQARQAQDVVGEPEHATKSEVEQ